MHPKTGQNLPKFGKCFTIFANSVLCISASNALLRYSHHQFVEREAFKEDLKKVIRTTALTGNDAQIGQTVCDTFQRAGMVDTAHQTMAVALQRANVMLLAAAGDLKAWVSVRP